MRHCQVGLSSAEHTLEGSQPGWRIDIGIRVSDSNPPCCACKAQEEISVKTPGVSWEVRNRIARSPNGCLGSVSMRAPFFNKLINTSTLWAQIGATILIIP